VATGLALACKFSCALVLPVLLIVWILRGRRGLATARRVIPLALVVGLVAFVTLWATYAFDVGRIDRMNVADAAAVAELPRWLRETPLPMPTAFVGYAVLARHNRTGHVAYLNGEVGPGGWWHYFPEAIAIKSPVAMLAAVAGAVVVMMVSTRRRSLRTACAVVPLAVFLLASMSAGINIGVRHVLPAIPFLYLFASMWLARGRWLAVVAGLVLVAVIETSVVHPDYLAFFNALVGGPRNGDKYLLDSNLDWGQDMERLRAWLGANARGRTVTLRLFGNPRLYEWRRSGDYVLLPPGAPPQGLFGISKNYLHDVYAFPGGSAWVRKLEPVARVGYSIEVYDLDANARAPTP
jgi:hypothetical protein